MNKMVRKTHEDVLKLTIETLIFLFVLREKLGVLSTVDVWLEPASSDHKKDCSFRQLSSIVSQLGCCHPGSFYGLLNWWSQVLTAWVCLFFCCALEKKASCVMLLILKDRWKHHKTHNPHMHTTQLFREYNNMYLHYWLQSFSHFSLFFSPSLSALGVMKVELNSVNMKESLSKLTVHSSSKLASQASSILATLSDTS